MQGCHFKILIITSFIAIAGHAASNEPTSSDFPTNTNVGTKDQMGDPDPLSVLENRKKEKELPTVPEFKEVKPSEQPRAQVPAAAQNPPPATNEMPPPPPEIKDVAKPSVNQPTAPTQKPEPPSPKEESSQGLADKPQNALDGQLTSEDETRKTKTSAFVPIQIPPAKKTRPVLKHIPPSLPTHVVEILDQNEIDFSNLEARKALPPPSMDLSYYLSEGSLVGDGEVKEIESGHSSASLFQNVFVNLKDGSQKNYYVVKEMEQIPNPEDKHKSLNATIIEVQGEIEILDKVNDSENLYRAVVKRNIQPIELGSKLIPGLVPQVNTSKTNIESTATFKVIGGEFNKDRWLLGSESLVFLNGGRSQGLHEGQSLAVYSTSKNRNKNSKAIQNDRQIGVVKVVHLTDSYATAYILKSSEEILVGDEVGSRSSVASSETVPPPPPASDLKIEENKGPAPVEPSVEAPKDSAPAAGPQSDELSL